MFWHFETLYLFFFTIDCVLSFAALNVVAPGQSLVRANAALVLGWNQWYVMGVGVWSLLLALRLVMALALSVPFEWRYGQCREYVQCAIGSKAHNRYQSTLAIRLALIACTFNFLAVLGSALDAWDLRLVLTVIVINSLSQAFLLFAQAQNQSGSTI